ncbi:carbon-nitrogen hydrolase family protein [Sphingobium sp. DEHP117]|uniref:carbon-nitrogen hydrolase family protein n=1 Tax=Sphingobium sp. DEHP117 TaxID=2993436 RepID=UPI0027D761C5|nr:nitrilase-related carbon-nitrogen hydrolase [Sphingobium sp. DEHP117]MDQ4419130.1 carbon-nitrogen hydrolase family protein [Sphingobium sp. DEHP117]
MRAALLQSTSGVEPAANAERIVAAIAEAKAGGADMLFTPEMVGCLDRNRERAAATLTDEARDRVLRAVRQAAREAGLWVHIGSLGLRDERADGRWINRGFVIDPAGDIRARYDKIHLFDVELPDGISWRESAVYGPGDALAAVDTPWGRMGLSICYDLRFADLYRRLSDAGAAALLIPAAFTVPTGKAHWETLLRARAIESACFVIAAAQVGHHEDGRDTYGHSMVVDPWGEVLLDMGDKEGLAFADIDFARVEQVRARIPVLAHRRALPERVTVT